MKKLTISFLILAAVTAIYSTISTTQLAAETTNFSTVSAFSFSTGRVGFFDRSNGKLYIYEGDLKTCVFSGQITELGKPLEPLLASNATTKHTAKSNATTTINEKGEKTVTLKN